MTSCTTPQTAGYAAASQPTSEHRDDGLTLRDAYPDVYSQLALFYRQDPAARLAPQAGDRKAMPVTG